MEAASVSYFEYDILYNGEDTSIHQLILVAAFKDAHLSNHSSMHCCISSVVHIIYALQEGGSAESL